MVNESANIDFFLATIGKALYEMLVIHALRPDRLLASAHILVTSAFGNEFMQQDKVLNLREIVEDEVLLIMYFCLNPYIFRCQVELRCCYVRQLALTRQER